LLTSIYPSLVFIQSKIGFYSDFRSTLLKQVKYSSFETTALLRIAHKYCMQSTEDEILTMLKADDSTAGYVELMVASQIIGSPALHQQALKAMISSESKPNLEQAKRIGIEAYHELMQGQAFLPPAESRWVHCSAHAQSYTGCPSCRAYIWDHCPDHRTASSWGCTNCRH
jgi:hypothetical protein